MPLKVSCALESPGVLGKIAHLIHRDPAFLTPGGKESESDSQLCPTLCDPVDYRVHGILQARILEWVAYLFSRGSSGPRNQTGVSCIAGGFFTS